MIINLERLDDAFHLRATNAHGRSVEADGNPAIGGGNKGMRPMEMLLSSLGSCSVIDIIVFLRKMRQELDDIKVSIEGERDPDAKPSIFKKIHLHYTLVGNIDPEKAQKAISLSADKYCSVSRIVEKTAEITWSYELVTATEEG